MTPHVGDLYRSDNGPAEPPVPGIHCAEIHEGAGFRTIDGREYWTGTPHIEDDRQGGDTDGTSTTD